MPAEELETEESLKCPVCNREISHVYYKADAVERGTMSVYTVQKSRYDATLGRCVEIPGEFCVESGDAESDDCEWNGETYYYCPECDAEIDLDDIKIQTFKKKEEIKPIEPEDAVESETHIIIKEKHKQPPYNHTRRQGMPFDMNETQTLLCEECNHLFVYGEDGPFAFCPSCGAEIDIEENKRKSRSTVEIINVSY